MSCWLVFDTMISIQYFIWWFALDSWWIHNYLFYHTCIGKENSRRKVIVGGKMYCLCFVLYSYSLIDQFLLFSLVQFSALLSLQERYEYSWILMLILYECLESFVWILQHWMKKKSSKLYTSKSKNQDSSRSLQIQRHHLISFSTYSSSLSMPLK